MPRETTKHGKNNNNSRRLKQSIVKRVNANRKPTASGASRRSAAAASVFTLPDADNTGGMGSDAGANTQDPGASIRIDGANNGSGIGNGDGPGTGSGSGGGNPVRTDAGTGTGNAGTDAGSGADYTGKVGRHPANCKCPRHSENGIPKGISQPVEEIPLPRSGDDLFNNVMGNLSAKGISAAFKDGIAAVWAAIYHVPIMMAWGEHWKLDEGEQSALVDSTVNFLDSLDIKERKIVMAALNKYMPASALIGTVLIVTLPKYYEMQRMKGGSDKRNATDASVQQPNDRTHATNAGDIRRSAATNFFS